MQCPYCKNIYKYKDVPWQNRKIKFLVTEFMCPYCQQWLKPGKAFVWLMAVATGFSLLGTVLLFTSGPGVSTLFWLGAILVLAALICAGLAAWFLRYEMKQS